MKKIFYPLAIIPLLITSCELEPDAYFYTDKVDVLVGEPVTFTNTSYNAYRFEWDFGDGNRSTAVNPVYSYNSTGTFQVMLTAITKRGNASYAYQTITVKYPTTLEVEVLEYFDEYPVTGASVLLYPTLADWDNESNALVEGFTNNSGKVIFTNLGTFVYFVDVWEKDHNNYTLRDEDVGFIRTQQLLPNQINRFVAWVDYVGGKGEGSDVRDRKMVIVKMERKHSDKK
ncbi:MAG: PKD domain-containing protein [Bacteroidetes bacterium]|nr:PKD domain-containing protein [Bacteroidota bacterium]